MKLLVSILMAVFSSVVSLCTATASSCPESRLTCNDSTYTTIKSPSQISCESASGNSHGSASVSGQWGLLHASSFGTRDEHGSASAELMDEYVLSGPEPGTEIVLEALLSAWGSIGPCPFTDASSVYGIGLVELEEPGGDRVSGQLYCTDTSEVLRLNIRVVAGQSFHLRSGVFSETTEASASLSASLRFSNLPSGATISSCHGFRQDEPVPAYPASWGYLKSRYR